LGSGQRAPQQKVGWARIARFLPSVPISYF
jgi:hypothetical protein